MFAGFEVIKDMIYGHDAEASLFPYVAWCDFEVRTVGSVNTRSVMCGMALMYGVATAYPIIVSSVTCAYIYIYIHIFMK